ncbi:MAG: hypothetical protein KKH72_01280 [Alphaproteobacteria bacterium]|nr:hypothetical protein [Alphaproteobacteria bacterium]
MSEQGCSSCPMRAKYDTAPKSLAGRFWRFHINFCPGWKKYFTALPMAEQQDLARRYNIRAAR